MSVASLPCLGDSVSHRGFPGPLTLTTFLPLFHDVSECWVQSAVAGVRTEAVHQYSLILHSWTSCGFLQLSPFGARRSFDEWSELHLPVGIRISV